MQWILYILLFAYLFSIILSLVATFFSSKIYLKPFRQNREKPVVTILKPIINIEPNLKENLISFFSQDYPEYQLSFCLERNDQEIIKLIEEVAAKYKRGYKIYTEPTSVGLNPKINNIYKAFNAAETQWVLISDSNVNAEKNYLEKLVSYIDENVASVSSTIQGKCPRSFASHIETILLNVFYSRWAGIMAYLKYTPVVGKGLLLKKQAVGDIGGLKVVSPFLAEDFMLGKFFQKKGFKTVLTAHGVCENVGHQTLRSVYQRHLRWGLIRKTSGFAAFILEPITYPLFSSLVGAYVLQQLFGFNFFLIFFINIFCFLTLDMIQFKMFSKRVYFFTPIAWLLKEVMALVLWFDILKSKSIYWRDKKFFLSKNSRLVFD